MENWITSFIEQFGYFGVFLLITLENLFPPIPSEVILTFSGFITTKTDLSVIGVVVVSTIGSVVGAVILYGIGRMLGINKIEEIVQKWGHILRLTKKDIQKSIDWFSTYGPWAVFFCRFIPLVRSLISLPAGMTRMNFGVFLLLTTLGTLIWNVVLVYIGYTVGESWENIVRYMNVYSNIIYLILVILLLWAVIAYIRKRV